jgi:NAD(P)-dependent dehydrogenase (short-subunit alcohol dehydrogenase family)
VTRIAGQLRLIADKLGRLRDQLGRGPVRGRVSQRGDRCPAGADTGSVVSAIGTLARLPRATFEFAAVILKTPDAPVGQTLRHVAWTHRGTTRYRYRFGQANYAASKSGLFGLTKTPACEAAFQLKRAGKLTEDGIGVIVNTVANGFIATRMLERIPEKVVEGIKERIPVRRAGRSDDINRVVRFLLVDESSFITGAIWGGVNGGMDI